MADPEKPSIPDGAPQEVKDFFDCKSDKYTWPKGKVDWLTIKIDNPLGEGKIEITPEVSFDHGKALGTIDITVSMGYGISGTVNASVNSDGQLVANDVSMPLKPFKDKIDDSIKRINDWFKHNHKKLKPAVLRKGAVTLEKTATTGAYAPPVVVPGDEDQNKPEYASLPPESGVAEPVSLVSTAPIGPTGAEWDNAVVEATEPPKTRSLMPILLLFLIGAAILGLITGILVFGGHGPSGVANASPTATPTASPTASPSASPTASPSASPTPTAAATASVPPSPSGEPDLSFIDSLCAQIIHEAIGNYVSQIQYELAVTTYGFGADRIEIELLDANDDQPAVLELDPETGEYVGYSGLHSPGSKSIVSVKAYYGANVVVDLTQEFIDYLGSDEILVRYPQEDSYGVCATPTP